MQLQVGDRLADATSEAHVRVQRVNQPGVTEIASPPQP
jgi:hypothetical protein